jgi:hypothetical protein
MELRAQHPNSRQTDGQTETKGERERSRETEVKRHRERDGERQRERRRERDGERDRETDTEGKRKSDAHLEVGMREERLNSGNIFIRRWIKDPLKDISHSLVVTPC